MRKLLKILGFVLGGIVLLLALGAGSIHFSELPSYEVQAPELQVVADSMRIAEGKRFAELICNHCHRGADGRLSGKMLHDIPPEFGQVWAPNITH
ncbi:MAG: cytochrome c, partial [Bacteroidetes bacterium]